ncbi:hypothetical protein [Exiguobacterium sp. S22-S28]|uniref:hypothetical protein n=1 Tax=Exiguobacterium sp. S22-S28 TaxID=3342768 RepID=UPI00372D643B
MSNHNLIKLDEHQLITCIRYLRWGSSKRFRIDQSWKKNDIIYFVVGEELAAKAIIESEQFYESPSVWTEDKYKFHLDIKFESYILPENRKKGSAKTSILLDENIDENMGNYYRGIKKLLDQQVYNIEEEFKTSSTVSSYKTVINKYFVTSFIDRMDNKINIIKSSARVNYYKKEDEVLDYINTLWFIALITHEKKLVKSAVFDQEKVNVIEEKFNEIKKIKKESDREISKKKIKNIHMEVAQIFKAQKGIFELYGVYFEKIEPEYLKIINIIDDIKKIISEFVYVESQKELFDNLTLDWFINRYIDSFVKSQKKVSGGVSWHLSTILNVINDGAKFSVNTPLSYDSGITSNIAKLDDKIIMFKVDDFSYTAIRTTIIRLVANKLSIDKIQLNEAKFISSKKEPKINIDIEDNYFLIMNTIPYSREESIEKLLQNIQKIDNDSIIISLLSLNDFIKSEDDEDYTRSFIYKFKQVASSIVASDIFLGGSEDNDKIVLMIGKKNKNNDNFNYSKVDNDYELINYNLFSDHLLKEGYIENKDNFESFFNHYRENYAIKKTVIKNNRIRLRVLGKLNNKKKIENSEIVESLSNNQKELLNYILTNKKNGEYFSTNELIEEFNTFKKITNEKNYFFYESTLELLNSLGILKFSQIKNNNNDDNDDNNDNNYFYTSELKKWSLKIKF